MAIAVGERFALLLNIAGIAISAIIILLPLLLECAQRESWRITGYCLVGLWSGFSITSIVAVSLRS
jgi:hypothetical protein